MRAIARWPIEGGHVAVYPAAGAQIEVRREDEDGRPLGAIFIAQRELAVLGHLVGLAEIAVRPGRAIHGLLPHEFDLELEERDGMQWYDEVVAQRARGDA